MGIKKLLKRPFNYSLEVVLLFLSLDSEAKDEEEVDDKMNNFSLRGSVNIFGTLCQFFACNKEWTNGSGS